MYTGAYLRPCVLCVCVRVSAQKVIQLYSPGVFINK